MRIEFTSEGIPTEGAISKHKICNPDQCGSGTAARWTCGINVVEVGFVKSNQLDFESYQPAFATFNIKLWPQLPENVVFRDCELDA